MYEVSVFATLTPSIQFFFLSLSKIGVNWKVFVYSGCYDGKCEFTETNT